MLTSSRASTNAGVLDTVFYCHKEGNLYKGSLELKVPEGEIPWWQKGAGTAGGAKAENSYLVGKAQRAIGDAKSLKSQSPQHKTIPSEPPHSVATTGASIQMIETGGHLTQIIPSSIRKSRPIFYSLASIVPISLPTGLTTSLPT